MSLEDLSTKSELEVEQIKVSSEMKDLVSSISDESQKDTLINPFTVSLISQGYDPLEYRLYYILIGQEDPGNKYKFDIRSKDSIDPFDAGLIRKFIETNFKK